jgi:hypothetical protein
MVKSILGHYTRHGRGSGALDARVNNFLAAVSKEWGGLNYFRALSMRHFFGGTSRSLVTLELRTFIASEVPASICAGACPRAS